MTTESSTPLPGVGPGAAAGSARRHQALGPFLCWAVVFADIGTSVYYVPGILYGTPSVRQHAALFVTLTMVVFVLLTLKYAEVTARYPQGGGVVTVGTRAIHPFVGLLGGMFILVDYFLTAALSALSGVIYLSVVVPSLTPLVLPVTLLALVILGVLNWVGISESATASALFAAVAFVSQVVVVLAVVAHVGIVATLSTVPRAFSGPRLSGVTVLTGFAGAFLAFSGLESISQLSPVMATPRQRVARVAMGLVVATIVLTSPLLTLFATTLLDARKDDPNQFISKLGGFALGRALEVEVAVSGAALLIFASNTALIGTYHVFLALSRMRFFPQILERRNRLRGTPHWAIGLAVGIPLLILLGASGSADIVTVLGDLYAFGLLGAFSLTCLSLDIVRWRERRRVPLGGVAGLSAPSRGVGTDGPNQGDTPVARAGRVTFGVGVLTTALVILAWSVNLVAKPLATEFGGGVTFLGLLVAALNYALLDRRGRPAAFPSEARAIPSEAVLVVLPARHGASDALVHAAATTAGGRPVVFLYRGASNLPERAPRLFEVVDPYLEDRAAQDAFGAVERVGRRLRVDRRYIYVPNERGPDAVARVWQAIRPRDTLVAADDADALHDAAPDRVGRQVVDGRAILHYRKHWPSA